MQLYNVSCSEVCPICNKGHEFEKKKKQPLYESEDSDSSSSDAGGESQPEMDTFDSEMKWWVSVTHDIKEERRKIMARYLSVIAKFQSDIFVQEMLDVNNNEDDIVDMQNNLSHMRRELIKYEMKTDNTDNEDETKETFLIIKAIDKEILVLERKILRYGKVNGRKYDCKKHMDQSIADINALFESNAKRSMEHIDLKPVINHRCMKGFVDKVLGKTIKDESEKHWTCRKCSQEPSMWKCAICRTEVRSPIPYVESDDEDRIEQDSLLARELEEQYIDEDEAENLRLAHEAQQQEEEAVRIAREEEEAVRIAREEEDNERLYRENERLSREEEENARLLREKEEIAKKMREEEDNEMLSSEKEETAKKIRESMQEEEDFTNNRLELEYQGTPLQEETQTERLTRLLRESRASDDLPVHQSEAEKWAVQERAITSHINSMFSGFRRQEEKGVTENHVENSISSMDSAHDDDLSDEIDDLNFQDSRDTIDKRSVDDKVAEDSDTEHSEDAQSLSSYKESKKRFFSERFIEHKSEDESDNSVKKSGKMKRRAIFDDEDEEISDESENSVNVYGKIKRRTIDNKDEDSSDSDSDNDDGNLINDIHSVNIDDITSDDDVHESDAIEDEDHYSDDEENGDNDDDAVFHSEDDEGVDQELNYGSDTCEDYYSYFLDSFDEVRHRETDKLQSTQDEVYERFGDWIREHGTLFKCKFNENRLARRRSFDASGLSMMEYVAKTNLRMSYRKPPQRQYKSVQRNFSRSSRRYRSPKRYFQRDQSDSRLARMNRTSSQRDDTLRRKYNSPPQRHNRSPQRDDTLRRKYHSPPQRHNRSPQRDGKRVRMNHGPPQRHNTPPRRDETLVRRNLSPVRRNNRPSPRDYSTSQR